MKRRSFLGFLSAGAAFVATGTKAIATVPPVTSDRLSVGTLSEISNVLGSVDIRSAHTGTLIVETSDYQSISEEVLVSLNEKLKWIGKSIEFSNRETERLNLLLK